MSLQPKIGLIQSKSSGIIAQDATGNYDVASNPGGYGAPNPLKANITAILTQLATYGEDLPAAAAFTTQQRTDYLGAAGTLINGTTVPDGVYELHVLIGFAAPATLSAPGTSGQFTMTGASTVFGVAVGFTIDSLDPSKLYRIDRTKVLNGTGGYATETLPGVAGESVTIYYEAERKILIYDQGEACLLQEIAKTDLSCGCEEKRISELMERYAQYLSMYHKFSTTQDYEGAHKLAVKLYNDCFGTCDPCGNGIRTVTELVTCVPPTIVSQPAHQTVNAGQDATFSVLASGTSPKTYQWYKNGVLMAGETEATLRILNVTNSNQATYKCVVSNACGTVESEEAELTVTAGVIPVTITLQPQNIVGASGTTVIFTVAATGSPTITYQWRKNGVNINGETGTSLTLTNIDSGDEATYDVQVTNPAGSVLSTGATLTLGVIARCGWSTELPNDTNDIDALQVDINYPAGGVIPADFRANDTPLLLIMAEPSTEPVKTTWWANPLNNGNIAPDNTSDTDLFYVVGIIGSYRVYCSKYYTQNTEDIIEFRP